MKFLKVILLYIIAGLGMGFLTAPFLLHRFIHGDDERYLWIIRGPYPFSHFGGGPFQLFTYVCLFLIGLFFTLLYVIIVWRTGNGRLSNPEQSEKREENLQKVLELAREKDEIRNDDVQYALGVSDATATRYLDELENQGKLVSSGSKKGTIYRPK